MKRFLFVDFWITGHHLEFIMHLVRAKVKYEEEQAARFFFLLSPEVVTRYPELNALDSFFFLSSEEKRHYVRANRINASRFLIDKTGEIAFKNNINEVIFLYGNEVLPYGLARRFNYTFSFIFFQPPFREIPNSFFASIKKKFKERIYFFLVRKESVNQAFILNDQTCVHQYNVKTGTHKFMLLNDPVLPSLNLAEPLKDFDSGTRSVFGHLGSLDRRKGTLAFLDAIGRLSQEYLSRSTFIIAGKATDSFHELIVVEIEKLKEAKPVLSIEYTPGFLDDRLFNELFLRCDSIVLPYSNPQASSGLAGKAIVSGKHIICPGTGLIGEIVAKYGMCNLIKPPDDLVTCLERFLDKKYGKINEAYRNDFREKSNPEYFIQTLISHV